jgi:hypothetical protein
MIANIEKSKKTNFSIVYRMFIEQIAKIDQPQPK